ncbi:hypothetical protein ACQVRV_18945 (plasmid) [Ralstonia pseudosolanacearum]
MAEEIFQDEISCKIKFFKGVCKLKDVSRVENSKNSVNKGKEFFGRIIGKKCWSIIAGAGTGSMMSLGFGEKIRRERSVRNTKLSPEQQDFMGEFVLFVKDSPWRIVNESNETICSSDDSNEDGGPMLAGLNRLIGRSVVSVNIANDTGGLDLLFSDGLCVQLKGVDGLDGLDGFDTSDSYTLFYSGRAIEAVG